MKNLTYRDVLESLKGYSDEQLDLNVSVYVRGPDEYYPVVSMEVCEESLFDVLDDNHPYFVI